MAYPFAFSALSKKCNEIDSEGQAQFLVAIDCIMNVSNPKGCYFQRILSVLPAQSSIYIHISTTNLQTHYYFYLKVKVER